MLPYDWMLHAFNDYHTFLGHSIMYRSRIEHVVCEGAFVRGSLTVAPVSECYTWTDH
jgi:hypothetical protein